MAPKMVYLGAACLAALQTSQAFIIPSSFSFPGLSKESNQGHHADDDRVNVLPIPKEDEHERLKNLQLGVSKPWPLSSDKPSEDLGLDDLNAKLRQWWHDNVPAEEIKHKLQEAKESADDWRHDIQDDAEEKLHDAEDVANKWAQKVPAELEDKLHRVEDVTEDWGHHVHDEAEEKFHDAEDITDEWIQKLSHELENKLHEVEDVADDWRHSIQDEAEEKWHDAEDVADEWRHKIHEVQDDVPNLQQSAEEMGHNVLHDMEDKLDDAKDLAGEWEQEMSEEFYQDLDHAELIFGEWKDDLSDVIKESLDKAHDASAETVGHFYTVVEVVNGMPAEVRQQIKQKVDQSEKSGEELFPEIEAALKEFGMREYSNPTTGETFTILIDDFDFEFSPEWEDKHISTPVAGGHRHHRCMKSRVRHALRSFAAAVHSFVSGFLIPVLVGVAAGMAASLFGMMVGTLCGWIWVKLFRGGRRNNRQDVDYIHYRTADVHDGEKDALLTVDAVEIETEDAPPTYVEKE